MTLRRLSQQLFDFFELEVKETTIGKAIKKDLGYSYKNFYFRSYEKNNEKITHNRFWLTFELF